MKLKHWLEIGASGLLLGLMFMFMLLHSNALDRVSVLKSDLRISQKMGEWYEQESARVEPLKNKLDAANRDILNLSERLKKAENMVALLEASVDDTLLPSANDADELQNDPDSDDSTSPFQDVLKSMDPDTMAKMQAANVLAMGYRRLFRELGLDAQTEATVRAVIQEETEGQMRAMFARLKDGDDPTPTDNRSSTESLRATIRQRLGPLLAEDHLQILDEYDVDYEMLAGGIETQLTMYAPDLSDESASLARDVVVEELLATNEEAVTLAEDEERSEWDRQIEAMQHAEARLAELLGEEEMIPFRRYMEQHTAMAESMRSMMEDRKEPAQ